MLGIGQNDILFVGSQSYNSAWVEPSIQPEQAEPATETNAGDEPRHMTLFKPFLRPMNGEDKGWGNTVWMTQLLNEERAKAGEPQARHDNVLRGARTAMEKLGETALLNFEQGHYADKNGQMRPLIRFSHDVLFNVVAEVGGKVEHQLLKNHAAKARQRKRELKREAPEWVAADTRTVWLLLCKIVRTRKP